MEEKSDPAPAPITDRRSLNPKGTLLFGFFRYKRIDGRVRVRPVWGRFFLGFVVLLVVGWLSLATAAWAFVTYKRGVPGVSFFDIAIPARWEVYQRKRGDDYIQRAIAAQAENKYREAFQLYRVGLAKSPANTSGRVRLANMLALLGRPDMAIEVMEAGLKHAGDDLGFLSNHLQLLLANQEDDRVLALVDERAPRYEKSSDGARLLALAGATACYFRGRFYRAEELLQEFNLQRSNEGRLLAVRLDWERGRTQLALTRLRALITEVPQFEEAHAALVGYLRILERFKEAQSAAVLRSLNFPESAPAQIDLLTAFRDAGSADRLTREIDSLLARAGQQPQLAVGVAEFAINTADVALADRIGELAATNTIPAHIGAFVAIEARLAARRYADALTIIDEILVEKPDWLELQAPTISGLQSVALFGTGKADAGELQLNAFLATPGLRPENAVAIVNRLKNAVAVEAARRVLARASRDSTHPAVLTALVEIDLDTGRDDDLIANVDRLLGLRLPSTTLLRRASDVLGRDRFLFATNRDAVLDRVEEILRVRSGPGT